MWNVKLKESQRPTLLRDGKGGPMRVVTSSNWVKFETMPEYMVDDASLEIEEIEASPKAPTPAPVATEATEAPTVRGKRGKKGKA